MPLPLVAIAGMTIARTLATRLGPRAISALKKMDKTKAKNAFKSKDTKRIDNVKNQIDKNRKVLKKETDIQKKYVEAGNVKKIKNLKGKETKLQKEKNILEKKKLAKKENIKKKVTSTVDLASRASLLPLIKRRKKEDKTVDKPIDKPVDKNKSESKIAPPTTSKTVTVKKGDTLSEILRDTKRVGNPNLTLGMIKKANPGINLNKISIGQKITLPKIVEKEGKSFIEDNTLPKKDARTVDTTLTPLEKRKSVYQDVDMSKITMKKRAGGPLQNIPAGNRGLPNLPTPVRNKMGFKKRGGKVIKRAVGGGVALRGLGAVRKV